MSEVQHVVPAEPLPPVWGRVRWALWVVGCLFVAYGVVFGVLALGSSTIGWLVFVLAGVVLHDGIITPLVEGIGKLVGLLPKGSRALVAAGLIVTGSVLAVTWPYVLRLGESPGLPSFLPRNYTAGLLITLAAVVVGVAAVAAVRRLTSRR